MMKALMTARKYFARVALGALLASATVTCADNDSIRSPSGSNAGEAGVIGEGGTGAQAGALEAAGMAPIGGNPASGGGGAGNDNTSGRGGSAENGGSAGNGAVGGSSGGAGGNIVGGVAGMSGVGAGGNIAGGVAGMSGVGTSGGGTGGGGTGGGGTGGGGTGGGGTGGTGGGGTGGGGTGGGGTGGGGFSGGGSPAGGGGTGGSSGNNPLVGGTAGQSGSGGTSTCPSSAACTVAWSTENCGANCGAITSAACLACEPPEAADAFCSVLGDALAQAGSAVGQRRLSLCNKALACLRQTGCSLAATTTTEIVAPCYCGSVPFDQCTAQTANGPCRAEFEQGLETSSPNAMTTLIQDTTLGTAIAYYRTTYDTDACTSVCFAGQ